MLIALEGPDGAGKTTLARELANELGAEVLHRGPPTAHPLDEYETPLFDYRPGGDRHIVCDRWHVGEWVYPQVLGRKTKADDATWRHLELFLAARGAVVVYLLPKLELLEARVTRCGDWLITPDQLARIRDRYMLALASSVVTPTVLETGESPCPERVIAAATYFDRAASRIKHTGSYVGPADPAVLLVGERRGFDSPYPPAFGPYPATCGHWMLSAVNEMRDYGLANAYEEDLGQLWESLGRPRVVALGRRADEELTRASVRHGAVPHPQYVRRFHHRERRWYQNLIARASVYREDLQSCRP